MDTCRHEQSKASQLTDEMVANKDGVLFGHRSYTSNRRRPCCWHRNGDKIDLEDCLILQPMCDKSVWRKRPKTECVS